MKRRLAFGVLGLFLAMPLIVGAVLISVIDGVWWHGPLMMGVPATLAAGVGWAGVVLTFDEGHRRTR